MTLKTYDAGGADPKIWEDDDNWGGVAFPQNANDEALINISATAIVTTGTITIGKLRIESGFTGSLTLGGALTIDDSGTEDGSFTLSAGTFDANDLDVIIDGDALLDGGTVIMGAGSIWTVNGSWDSDTGVSITEETSTIKMTGTGKTITGGLAVSRKLETVEIASGATISTAGTGFRATIVVNGTLTVTGGQIAQQEGGTLSVGSSGSITGTGKLQIRGGTIDIGTGSIDIDNMDVEDNVTINAGTYDSATVIFKPGSTGSRTATFAAGTFTFSGNVTMETSSSGTYTVNMNTNNPNITFKGNFTLDEQVGATLNFNQGTGTLTFAGTALQTVTFDGKNLKKVKLTNVSAGGVTFADLSDLDLCTIDTTAGNVLLKLDETATHTIDELIRIGAGSNDFVLRSEVAGNQADVVTVGDQNVTQFDVKDSNMSGGTYTVTDGTDSGNNSANWVFVVVVVADFGVKVFVDGVEIGPIKMGTLTWTDKLEARGPLRFTIKRKGPPPYTRPIVGQTVDVFNNGTKIWSGTIDDVGENEPVKDAVAFFPIQAINHNQIMDRYVVVRIYDNITAGSIIKDAITDFVNINGENIDTSLVQDGPIIERAVFGYKTMTDVLRELSNISGFSWFVDCDLKLHFEDRATTNAPFGLFDGSKNYRKLKIKRTRGQYLNVAILLGGDDTSDLLQEDFAGDPGGKRQTFTVALDFASKPAVTLDTGGGPVTQTVGERSVDDSSAFQWFFRKGEKELSQRSSDTPISGTDVLSITYNGLFPIVQITEDTDEIAARAAIEGGGGVYKRVEEDESIESRLFAIQKNEAKLRRFGKIPTKATYETDDNGLFAGQLQNINLPTRGADMVGNFLISEVTARAIPGFKDDAEGNPIQVIRYQVKILSGEFLGGWVNFFKLWLLTGRTFKLNEEEVIVLVRSFTEGIEMAEAFNTVDALEPIADDPFTGFQWGSAVEDRGYWGTLTDGTGFRQTTGSQWINPPVDA